MGLREFLCYGAFFKKKIQDLILKSENGVCVSLLNRLIQDLSGHGASKGIKESNYSVPLNQFCTVILILAASGSPEDAA